jgi:hypothetical protein
VQKAAGCTAQGINPKPETPNPKPSTQKIKVQKATGCTAQEINKVLKSFKEIDMLHGTSSHTFPRPQH